MRRARIAALVVGRLVGRDHQPYRRDREQAAGDHQARCCSSPGGICRPSFDLIVGLNRWGYRVIASSALRTDAYPPSRLGQGGTQPPSAPSNVRVVHGGGAAP